MLEGCEDNFVTQHSKEIFEALYLTGSVEKNMQSKRPLKMFALK